MFFVVSLCVVRCALIVDCCSLVVACWLLCDVGWLLFVVCFFGACGLLFVCFVLSLCVVRRLLFLFVG